MFAANARKFPPKCPRGHVFSNVSPSSGEGGRMISRIRRARARLAVRG